MAHARPEGLKLRALRVADAERLHALHSHPQVFRSGGTRLPNQTLDDTRQWIERLAASVVALIAEIDGALAGCAELYPGSGRRAHTASVGISVHPDWQRRGVGSALLGELLDVADNWLGLRRVELQVFADNAAAIALYRRFGFEQEAHERGVVLRDGVLDDGLVMARLTGIAPRTPPVAPPPDSARRGAAGAVPEDIVVRPYTNADMPGIADVMSLPGVRYGTLGVSYRTPDALQQWFDRQRTGAGLLGFVATHGDTLVGLTAITLNRPRRAHVGVLLLCVHDAWHGRGVGGRLLDAAIACADASAGLRRIELTVFVDNEPALALYRRAGFAVEGRARAYALRAGVYEDVYLMARTADAPPFASR